MREFFGVTLAAVILIGIGVGAVEGMGDRDLFVPPPETVAEGFMREVMTKRWARARQYLVTPEAMSDEQLESLQQSLEERVGDPLEIDAKELDRHDETARVQVRLSSARGSECVTYRLTFADEWKVAMP
jgi:hypothetical protein